MWIIQKSAVSEEQQASIQKLQISFRSGEIAYPISLPKPWGFSQSLLGIQKVVISYGKNQISADSD